jgi:hypothetical protein
MWKAASPKQNDIRHFEYCAARGSSKGDGKAFAARWEPCAAWGCSTCRFASPANVPSAIRLLVRNGQWIAGSARGYAPPVSRRYVKVALYKSPVAEHLQRLDVALAAIRTWASFVTPS